MILSRINHAIERKLAAGAMEFALTRYQDARMAGSVDAQLAAAQALYEAGKGTLAHLIAVEYEMVEQPRLGPIGIA